ncbi:MAG TPA: hypothetical protein PKA06_16660, partial [Gemmatales bacterium]|nr:hypothetical protein [Gemmatales bacterium]
MRPLIQGVVVATGTSDGSSKKSNSSRFGKISYIFMHYKIVGGTVDQIAASRSQDFTSKDIPWAVIGHRLLQVLMKSPN